MKYHIACNPCVWNYARSGCRFQKGGKVGSCERVKVFKKRQETIKRETENAQR
jgi:hypothetical protein